MIGRTLSHYRILTEIGRGGMGIVYRAVDVKLNREVALKVLPPELVADPERKRRFVQEAQAAPALEHPHIAVVHEIDEVDGVTFIVMELIRGEKLRDLLAIEPLPHTRTLEIALDVAEGLAHAHDKRIVHRDLKPANIMITEDGHVKIIDFGLAKLIEPLAGEGSDIETTPRPGPSGLHGLGVTDPGIVMGTVSYMSPEQARGSNVDHRSDVFSFGVVLYEMLAGQAPFRSASAMDTLSAILREPTPRLPDLGPDVTNETDLQRLVDKCLAKEPSERYQWMKDLIVDLRSVRRQLESLSPVAAPSRDISRRIWVRQNRTIPVNLPEIPRIKLRVLEIHDLIISKLKRFSAKDRRDVRALCNRTEADIQTLRDRYRGARLLRDYDEGEKIDLNFRVVEVEYLGREATEFE
jgi:serine/threonine protein kinase